MSLPTIIALFVAAVPVLMLAIFTMEVVAGLHPSSRSQGAGLFPDVVVLIPAHDEAEGIGAMLSSLQAVISPSTRVLVIADNCTDDTAMRARHAGAAVLERCDAARRGKGYALAFGRDHLAASPPDCVVVLDADCTIEPGGVAELAQVAIASGRAVQASYLQRPDLAASPKSQISSFAFLVKNLVRQRGMTRIGNVAAMTGTGMAIPWSVFAEAPLASADLAEDLALCVWLTRKGRSPLFIETATVWSDAASESALMSQRNRWERGFLTIARQKALPLILNGVVRGSRSTFWLGLHLIVPPLALLFVVAGAAFAVTLALAAAGASLLIPACLGIVMLGAGGATIAAWNVAGREQISGAALLRVPLYVAAKLPLYRSILRGKGEHGWVRTKRAHESD